MQSVLILVVAPAAILGLLAVLTLVPGSARAPRYRPGQEWDHPPVWWTADPSSLRPAHAHARLGQTARTARGGARGTW